jgi:hypothetical protein
MDLDAVLAAGFALVGPTTPSANAACCTARSRWSSSATAA